ncbi:MAG TPA: thioredoxin-disulfide reductase [Oligoflexia bacterium]|nr:thioredoxin-disulfide reductase [Oligoflexia bacterium]HMP48129.1 thioredoxin-disulfide reductase [Oligoflexia bacterium]
MNKTTTFNEVIILGTGPAGLTAGIYTARANLSPIIIQGPQPGGQLTTTTDVENFPGFSGGVMGPDLMVEMEKQAVRFGAKIKTGWITEVDLSKRPFTLKSESEELTCQALIIATGATAKTLSLPRESELMGFGLSTCATCDGAFFRDQEIVVIGGGDSACEEAAFLTKFGSRVRIILRRDEFRASKIMIDRVMKNPKIEVIFNQNVVELLGDRASGITGAKLISSKTGEESTIQCSAIFYAIGHTPNTNLFKGVLEMDENGYLKTAPNSTKTSIPGVFACGDVQDHVFRQAITAAGSGCMGAIEAERYLAEQGD